MSINTSRFVLFESGSINDKCNDNRLHEWVTCTHPANSSPITSENDMFNMIVMLYIDNDIAILVDNYDKSFKNDIFYTTIKDDIECRNEVLLYGYADIYYIASLFYRFKHNWHIRDFVVDYIVQIYEKYKNDSMLLEKTIVYAIITGYDRFAQADDTLTMRQFIQTIIDRGVNIDYEYYRAIILLYMSYNYDEENTVGSFIISRNTVEFMFEIGLDENIAIDFNERDMLKNAYLPLNKSRNSTKLNDLQSLIVKTIVFSYSEDYNDPEHIDVLVDAFKKYAAPLYINHLLEHINEGDCDSIIIDLISICRSYMIREDHFIIIDEDRYESTIEQRASYEFGELITMATEDEQDILNEFDNEVEKILAEIIKPFDFEFDI